MITPKIIKKQLYPSYDDEDSIQVFVKLLTGHTLTIDFYPSSTIEEVKLIIFDKKGIQPDR